MGWVRERERGEQVPIPFVEIPILAGVCDHRRGSKDRYFVISELDFESIVRVDEWSAEEVREESRDTEVASYRAVFM